MNRRRILLGAGAALGAAMLHPVSGRAAGAARIIAFPGYTPAHSTYEGTGTEAMVKQLRGLGIEADIYNTDQVDEVADRILAGPRPSQVKLLGYSFGARSAIALANRLTPAGVPIPLMVLLDSWYPIPITGRVPRVVNYTASGVGTEVFGGPGFAGEIDNIDLRTAIPGLDASHLTASTSSAIQHVIVETLLRGRPAVSKAG